MIAAARLPLRRNRCLDQRLAVIADPFATHMPLNRKHAGRVIQLYSPDATVRAGKALRYSIIRPSDTTTAVPVIGALAKDVGRSGDMIAS